jgi:hypothetical protein
MADANVASTTVTWLSPALTAFGGFVTAALSFVSLRILDARKDERTYQREKEAREDARRDAIIEARNRYQRKALFQLQDAVFNLVRACVFLALTDRRSESWHAKEANYIAARSAGHALTHKLGVRIRDDEVRETLKDLKKQLIDNEIIEDAEARRTAFLEITPITKRLDERIRIVLKQMDEIELAK